MLNRLLKTLLTGLLFITGCQSLPPPKPALVTGQVMAHKEPVPNAKVWLSALSGANPDSFSTTSDQQGRYRLAAPPGRYLIRAQAGNRAAYFGGNPLALTDSTPIKLNLQLLAAAAPALSASPGHSKLTGYLYDTNGAALNGATVELYTDSATFFRGPGYAATQSDSTGQFELELLPGSYYVVARKRAGGAKIGPLQPGDHFAFYPYSPVTVAYDSSSKIAMELLLRPKSSANLMISTAGTAPRRNPNLAGVVTNRGGWPVAGVYVSLYTDPDMVQKPQYMTGPTDSTGLFAFYGVAPGGYYLGSRSSYGAPPQAGEWFGRYDQNRQHYITVDARKPQVDLKIKVFRLLQ